MFGLNTAWCIISGLRFRAKAQHLMSTKCDANEVKESKVLVEVG